MLGRQSIRSEYLEVMPYCSCRGEDKLHRLKCENIVIIGIVIGEHQPLYFINERQQNGAIKLPYNEIKSSALYLEARNIKCRKYHAISHRWPLSKILAWRQMGRTIQMLILLMPDDNIVSWCFGSRQSCKCSLSLGLFTDYSKQ